MAPKGRGALKNVLFTSFPPKYGLCLFIKVFVVANMCAFVCQKRP
jgi:hypothetical protein